MEDTIAREGVLVEFVDDFENWVSTKAALTVLEALSGEGKFGNSGPEILRLLAERVDIGLKS